MFFTQHVCCPYKRTCNQTKECPYRIYYLYKTEECPHCGHVSWFKLPIQFASMDYDAVERVSREANICGYKVNYLDCFTDIEGLEYLNSNTEEWILQSLITRTKQE